jgi:cysteine sulfinate desulfinase/cysteine desulfurase-like protein
VMLANHETGAVQPVAELEGQLGSRAAFHCDAAQAVGKIPVDFRALGVTTLTLSAHKLHGPKGAGALLVRRDTKLRPQLWGGHQQRGRRPGTEPVALAVGLAAALEASADIPRSTSSGRRADRTKWARGLCRWPLPAAHAERVFPRLQGGLALDEPGPGRDCLLDGLGLLEWLPAPVAGVAGDGGSR